MYRKLILRKSQICPFRCQSRIFETKFNTPARNYEVTYLCAKSVEVSHGVIEAARPGVLLSHPGSASTETTVITTRCHFRT